ncbi:unnamed protein product, partial [Symbiodinium sp. KB8]
VHQSCTNPGFRSHTLVDDNIFACDSSNCFYDASLARQLTTLLDQDHVVFLEAQRGEYALHMLLYSKTIKVEAYGSGDELETAVLSHRLVQPMRLFLDRSIPGDIYAWGVLLALPPDYILGNSRNLRRLAERLNEGLVLSYAD